jgi:hypothetical protein
MPFRPAKQQKVVKRAPKIVRPPGRRIKEVLEAAFAQ